jgi:hypothetical protein
VTSTTITQSLSALQIERIIVVDDDVDVAMEAEPATSLRAHVDTIRDDLQVLGQKYPDVDLLNVDGTLRPNEELRDLLETLWEVLGPVEQEQLLSRVPSLVSKHLATIFEQVAENVPVVPHAVRTWNSEGMDALFAEGSPTTLVLFDLNLTNAGGSKTGGQQLLQELHGKGYSNVFFGILTQDAESLETETVMSAEFTKASDHAVPVLGKFRLQSADEFALGLAAFVLAEDLHQVRRHATSIIETAAADAVAHANTLGFYILLAAARSANNEGLYEGSGLVRMLFTLARRHTEWALVTEPPMAEIFRLRKVLERDPGFPRPTDAERQLIDDLYESAEHLHTTQAPTEVGDLYEFSDQAGQTSKYILLAQSCDLMVRSKGERFNGDGHFVLAKVVEHHASAPSSCGPHAAGEACGCVEAHPEPKNDPAEGAKLIPLGRVPGEEGEWVVNLAARAFVPPELLDACVFGADGRSEFPLPKDTVVPTLAWEKRRDKLNSWWAERRKRAIKHAAEVQAISPDQKLTRPQRAALQLFALRAEFGRHFAEKGLVSVTPGKADLATLVVGIRRIGRLTEPHAKAMLLQFSHYHSRPALPAALLMDAKQQI